MKKLASLLYVALALSAIGATAQQNANQGGGFDQNVNTYFAKPIYAEFGVNANTLQVGLVNPSVAPIGVPSYASGTVAAGANYAKIVAFDVMGNYTLPSPESSLVTTTNAGNIVWTWTAVPNALYYQIWVGATSGSEAYYFISSTNSFTQTLPIASGTAGTINTAATVGSTTFNGPVHFSSSTPSASAGTIAGTNFYGQVSGLSSATTTTITFANGGFTSAAYCTANTSVTATQPYITAISKTAVTFTFASLTGTLYYSCGGN